MEVKSTKRTTFSSGLEIGEKQRESCFLLKFCSSFFPKVRERECYESTKFAEGQKEKEQKEEKQVGKIEGEDQERREERKREKRRQRDN